MRPIAALNGFSFTLPKADGKKTDGLGVMGATVLIAGEMAGSGVLALPKAVVDSGWIGLVLIVVFCFISAYGGSRLGKCWEMIEERYPEYKGTTRDPYPVIAEKAMGKFGRHLVSVCNQVQLFGVCIVFLILASQIVEELLKEILPDVTSCMWLLIFASVLTPPMWLGSPKDFWFVGVGALVTTATSCLLIFIQMILDGRDKSGDAVHETHGFKDFFIAFGVILFSFGGAATFPTIQNDMNERNKFSRSVAIGFTIILLIYMPIAAGGYWVYGEDTKDNVIISLTRTKLVIAAEIFMALHLTTAFLIVINPASQEIENALSVPQKFTIKRCIVRTGMVCLMVFVAESIPQFAVILSLLGASTVSLTAFILPNVFYLMLCNQGTPEHPKREISWYSKVCMWLLVIIGVLGGVAATYSALESMFNSHFVKPCYWPK